MRMRLRLAVGLKVGLKVGLNVGLKGAPAGMLCEPMAELSLCDPERTFK